MESIMGNTNIPQFGALGTRNSRDTLVGDEQLTEEQKRERDAQKHGVGPAPGRPANAPERIPGQKLDPNDKKGPADGDEKHDHDSDVERPEEKDSHASTNTAGRSKREAFGGHANTGHSPSDAT
jgi:hypothetical protein